MKKKKSFLRPRCKIAVKNLSNTVFFRKNCHISRNVNQYFYSIGRINSLISFTLQFKFCDFDKILVLGSFQPLDYSHLSQLSGGLFSPSKKWKKLSHPLLLHFQFEKREHFFIRNKKVEQMRKKSSILIFYCPERAQLYTLGHIRDTRKPLRPYIMVMYMPYFFRPLAKLNWRNG